VRNKKPPKGGFLLPAIPGGQLAGRCGATLKMAPDHFLLAAKKPA
jgi:hypothetical protein